MLALLLCLISVTRTTFVYITEKILITMERRSFSSSKKEELNSDTSNSSDSQWNNESKDADYDVVNDRVSVTRATARSTRRCISVIDCIGANDGIVNPNRSTPDSRTRRMSSTSTVTASSSQDQSTNTDQSEDTKSEKSLRHSDTTDANKKRITRETVNNDDYPLNTSVTVTIPVRQDDVRYNMNHKNRGKCVIFNHEKFDNGFDSRLGSTADAKRIETCFKTLGFSVEVLDDRLHSEVLAKINELSEEDHTDNDCLCIFILTHGLSQNLISARDAAYRSDIIWKPFTADKCTTLAGKPKLFFFQACRGDKLDGGVIVRRSAERTETDSSVASYKIPTHADFLIAHSTVDGFLSWRNPEEGTWYVQCLCDVIDQYWKTTDLLRMLTITARKVATEYTSYDDLNPAKHEQTQVPSMTSMLIRDIYFTPK